jgi:2,3-bisphosphoglycerate-independent phosphoglycerate mutase
MKIQNATLTIEENEINAIVFSKLPKSQKMRNLFDAGLDIKLIATLLGVRYNFVYNVMQNHILKNNYVVEVNKESGKKEIVRALLAEGRTIAEISTEMATTYNYIWKLAKEIKSEEVNKVDPEEVKEVTPEKKKRKAKIA